VAEISVAFGLTVFEHVWRRGGVKSSVGVGSCPDRRANARRLTIRRELGPGQEGFVAPDLARVLGSFIVVPKLDVVGSSVLSTQKGAER